MKFSCLRSVLSWAALIWIIPVSPILAEDRPNILLITADDMNWDSVGVYGGPVKTATPNLDRLAREGMYFKYAHVNVAVCAPSRSIIMTGLYAHQSGAMGFAGMDSRTRTLSALLKANGYLVGIIDKVGHLKPREIFEWDYVKDAIDTGHGRSPGLFKKHTAEFLARAADEQKPFFLMANSRDPHRPFAGSYQEWQYLNEPKNRDEENFGQPPEKIAAIETPSRVYKTGEVPVPGFLVDTRDLRDEVADYYSSVRRCDDMVGAVLEAVEEAGHKGNTLVLFLSDNGMAFPFAKFSCYSHGTRTPFIARWPGVIKPNTVNENDVVSGIDITPTFLEAAGLKIPGEMEGRSILPLLKSNEAAGFDRAFTAFYISALEEEVPTRAVQEKQYGYIFNLWADGASQAQAEFYKGLALRSMIEAGMTDPDAAQRVLYFMFRTREELYDFEADPDGLNNLARNSAYHDTLDRLRSELLDWMEKTGDPITEHYKSYLKGEYEDFSGPRNPGELRRMREIYGRYQAGEFDTR